MFLEAVPAGSSLFAENVVHLTEVILSPASLSVCLFLNDWGTFVILMRTFCNFLWQRIDLPALTKKTIIAEGPQLSAGGVGWDEKLGAPIIRVTVDNRLAPVLSRSVDVAACGVHRL